MRSINLKKFTKQGIASITISFLIVGNSYGLSAKDSSAILNDAIFYSVDPTGTCSADGSSAATNDGNVIIRFLQALELGESGNPKAAPSGGGSASGKYQYIRSTWQGLTAGANAVYPPGSAYSEAYLAPADVQDAVAYLEYAQKFKALKGDLRTLAATHYIGHVPSAAELDQVPGSGGNILTVRQYEDNLIKRMNSGAGSKFSITPQTAPEFAKYQTAQGAPDPSVSNTGAPVSAITNNKPTIVLDPGHAANPKTVIDSQTGIQDTESHNAPEIYEVWDVSQQVKTKLEADGYNVVLTKQSADSTSTLRQRADIANNAHADLAISIHNDHGQSWDTFSQIYVQKVGLFRETPAGKKVIFTNASVAAASQKYANIFATERTAAEGHPTVIKDNDFGNRGLANGNIPIVQLFANVPWVYNEVGASPVGTTLSQAKIHFYATGLINSVEKAIPSASAAQKASATANDSCLSGNNDGSVVSGNILKTAENLAWNTKGGHTTIGTFGNPGSERRVYYDTWVSVDGHPSDTTDCGAFVATVMKSSGADRTYPSVSTLAQLPYVVNSGKYQIIVPKPSDTTAILQPGDIIVGNGGGIHHTQIWSGVAQEQGIQGSLGGQTPEIGHNPTWMFSANSTPPTLSGVPANVVIARLK